MIVYPEGTWYAKLAPNDVPEIVSSHLKQGQKVERLERIPDAEMKSEILDHRNKYLAMLRGKDAAGVLPDDIHDMVRSFMPSRALLTALELDVFTAVGKGGTAQQIAAKIQAAVRATEMLLNVLVSLKLLEKQDGIYTNTPVAARFLMEGSPDSARTAQLHMANMWRRWSKLTEAVRTGTAVESARDNGWVTSFIAAMDHTARGRARAVAQAVELDGEKRMLDLGGGSGAYSIAFVKTAPELHSEIVDLPEVLPITQEHIRQAGLSNRISTRPGDMLTVPLAPASYDLILLSAICHMFSPEENQQLLNRAYAALAPQGRLVIADFVLDADKTSPRFATLFALNMLVGTRAGASYSEPEYAEWMKGAGFASSKRVRMPGPVNLMIAAK